MEVQTGKQSNVALPHKQMILGHTNSGVLNHWFYILTIGSQEQMTLETLIMLQNIDKAAKIAYRLESVYLLILLMLMPELMVFNRQRTYTDGSPEVIAT
jgi:hypothetical protein